MDKQSKYVSKAYQIKKCSRVKVEERLTTSKLTSLIKFRCTPFKYVRFEVYGLASIRAYELNHYTRCFSWVIPASLGETRNLRKRAAELVFSLNSTESDE